MRIGIFGGSFDPIHNGHLILAERCREEAALDQVWFIPAARSPHKKDGAFGTDRQRTEMIEMALGGHESFRCSDIELKRGEISYTVDTLTQIRESNPDDQLFFLIGDDSLEGFHTWREPQRICELALPLVVNRPGSGEVDLTVFKQYVDDARYAEIEQLKIQSPMIEISSTEIRGRVESGKSIRYLVPRSVERYIETQNVYLKKSK